VVVCVEVFDDFVTPTVVPIDLCVRIRAQPRLIEVRPINRVRSQLVLYRNHYK
jgi:hypothetical protein